MKIASSSELKKCLETLSNKELQGIINRMIKYKKDNKELLTYLMYYSGDESRYIEEIKAEVDLMLNGLNHTNKYYLTKGVRKTLRFISKYVNFSAKKQTSVELRIHFCSRISKLGILTKSGLVMNNLYQRQIQKIKKTIAELHEDLQFDYNEEMKRCDF